MHPKQFQQCVLSWYQRHGRHDLPWQHNPTAYRVWVSEIMLQQTQVNTVIPFYRAFMKRFPNIKLLATAELDEVLTHWSGLGYYARARNLHKTAKYIYEQYYGRFPKTLTDIMALPGIGRSTAGAIGSFAMKQPTPILDGNVKRVLARFCGIMEWPGQKNVHDALWKVAEHFTPQQNTAAYNQAMMDLGSIICKRSQPRCIQCPLQNHCQARRQQLIEKIPAKKPQLKSRPKKAIQMLLIQRLNPHAIFLEKRPALGIWGGLWSFPECSTDENVVDWCKSHLKIQAVVQTRWPLLYHQFSHFELAIHPVLLQFKKFNSVMMESIDQVWHIKENKNPGGIAAPVAKLLSRVFTTEELV